MKKLNPNSNIENEQKEVKSKQNEKIIQFSPIRQDYSDEYTSKLETLNLLRRDQKNIVRTINRKLRDIKSKEFREQEKEYRDEVIKEINEDIEFYKQEKNERNNTKDKIEITDEFIECFKEYIEQLNDRLEKIEIQQQKEQETRENRSKRRARIRGFATFLGTTMLFSAVPKISVEEKANKIDELTNIEEALTEQEEELNKEKNEIKYRVEVLKELGIKGNEELIYNDVRQRYIDKYNEMNNTQLTANDIDILERYQQYMYQDQNDGKIFIHGGDPFTSEVNLNNAGIEYNNIDGELVYAVVNKNTGRVIDRIDNNKNYIYNAYYEDEIYNQEEKQSALIEMMDVIKAGLQFRDSFDSEKMKTDKDVSAEYYKQALIEYLENQQEKYTIQNETVSFDIENTEILEASDMNNSNETIEDDGR